MACGSLYSTGRATQGCGAALHPHKSSHKSRRCRPVLASLSHQPVGPKHQLRSADSWRSWPSTSFPNSLHTPTFARISNPPTPLLHASSPHNVVYGLLVLLVGDPRGLTRVAAGLRDEVGEHGRAMSSTEVRRGTRKCTVEHGSAMCNTEVQCAALWGWVSSPVALLDSWVKTGAVCIWQERGLHGPWLWVGWAQCRCRCRCSSAKAVHAGATSLCRCWMRMHAASGEAFPRALRARWSCTLPSKKPAFYVALMHTTAQRMRPCFAAAHGGNHNALLHGPAQVVPFAAEAGSAPILEDRQGMVAILVLSLFTCALQTGSCRSPGGLS